MGAHIPAVLNPAKCGHIHPERLVQVIDWSGACEGLLEPHLKLVMVRPLLLA